MKKAFELTTAMRAIWDDSGETDSRLAAAQILAGLPSSAHEPVFLDLLADAYSSFLSRVGREPVHVPEPVLVPDLSTGTDDDVDDGTPAGIERPAVRRNPSINPVRHTNGVVEAVNSKPYFVPSLRDRIPFRDMTISFWTEYAGYRHDRAAGYEASARWAEGIIARMEYLGVAKSGDLPDDVKIALFTAEPVEPEEG